MMNHQVTVLTARYDTRTICVCLCYWCSLYCIVLGVSSCRWL